MWSRKLHCRGSTRATPPSPGSGSSLFGAIVIFTGRARKLEKADSEPRCSWPRQPPVTAQLEGVQTGIMDWDKGSRLYEPGLENISRRARVCPLSFSAVLTYTTGLGNNLTLREGTIWESQSFRGRFYEAALGSCLRYEYLFSRTMVNC